MGVVLWAAAGLVAGVVARFVPAGRGARRGPEILVASTAGLASGVVATALDFGGWSAASWPAALLAFLGGAAAAGLLRTARLLRG